MFRIKKKTMVYRYFISFSLIALVPLIFLSSFLYIVNIANGKEKADQTALEAMVQVKSHMDYLVKDFSNIALYISSKYDLDQLFDGSTRSNNEIRALINHYEEIQIFSPEIIMYGRGQKRVHMNQGIMDYDAFEKRLGDREDMRVSRFFSRLNTSMAFNIFPNRSLYSSRQSDWSLCFLFPLPYFDITPDGTMVFTANYRSIHKLFLDYLGDVSGASIIFDPYLELIFQNDSDLDLSEQDLKKIVSQLTREKGTTAFRISLSGTGYTVFRIISENSGLTFAFIAPEKEFYKQNKLASLLFYTGLSALILLILIASVLLALHNYKPLGKVASMIDDKDSEGDEFEIISRGFLRMEGQNDALLSQIERQRPAIKERCLNRILFDGGHGEDFDYYLQCANIQFNHSHYCVLIMLTPHHIMELPLLYSDIETLKPFHEIIAYGVELNNEDDSIGIILNLTDREDLERACRDYAALLVDLIHDQYDMDVFIGMGQCYDNISRCANSFIEAKTALQFCDINGREKINYYGEISIEKNDVHEFPVKEQALFIQGLRSGNKSVANDALDQLIDSMEVQYISLLVMRYMGYEIVNQIVKIAHQKDIEFNSDEKLKEISVVSSLENFGSNLRELISLICDSINLSKQQTYDKLKKSIIEYINTHYCQNQMSLEMVSNQFDISLSYLMRIVKDETGRNFNSYVADLRLEEAKKHLRETDLKVKEIVTLIGYMDVANFTRKFRTIEGLTPGQYRTIQQFQKKNQKNM